MKIEDCRLGDGERAPLRVAAKQGSGIGVWVGVFLAAVVVRVVCLFHVEGLIYFYQLVGDARGYDLWATRLVADGGRWGETFYQAPLYPYFLAGVYSILGHDLWVVRVVQCALGGLGCVGVGLAGNWFLDRRAGVAAGVLMAFYPPGIYFDGIVQKASIGFVLMAGLLCVLGWGVRRESRKSKAESRKRRGESGARVDEEPFRLSTFNFRLSTSWFWCGVLVGLLGLTRENALVLGPVVVGWLLVTGRGWRRAGLVVLGLGLALAPAVYHNYRVGGELAVTTFQSGPNFYMGNHSGADGRYSALIPGRESPEFERADATAIAEKVTGRDLSPREVSRFWMGRALSYVRSEPVAWVRLMWVKWWLTWNRYEIPDTESYYICRDRSWLLGMLGTVNHFGVICPLAAFGVVATWRKRPGLGLLWVMALALGGSVALFYVFGRYRYPVVPIVAIAAGGGLVEGVALARAFAWRRLFAGVAVACAAAVWVNWPINPEGALNAEQLGNLGATLASSGRLDEAVPVFEEAVAMFPEGPRLQQFLADGLSLTGRYDEAVPHYLAALALEPGRAGLAFNLGVAFEQVGRLGDALESYRRAVLRDPADAEARAAVARLSIGRPGA